MAISYVGNMVLQAGGSGSPVITMSPPAGSAAGDLAQIGVVSKLTANVPTCTGWTQVGTGIVGTGADGAGAGQMRITVFELELTGAMANQGVSIAASTGAITVGCGRIWRKGAGEVWAPSTVQFGSDTVSNTTFAALVAAADGIASGDFVWSIGCTTIAAPSLTGRNNTIPGTTKTHTSIDSGGNTTGNDAFVWTDNEQITAGAQSSAGTVTGTTTSSTTGGGAQIRVHLSTGVDLNLGVATSTCTAQPMSWSKAVTLAAATSTCTAQPAALAKAAGLSTAVGTGTAQALAFSETWTLGAATETGTAPTLTTGKAEPFGASAESDTARQAVLGKALQLGVATEAGTAQATSSAKALSSGVAAETDTARAGIFGPVLAGAVAAESDAARSLSLGKQVLLGTATETSTARTATITGGSMVLGTAAEAGTAQVMAFTKAVTLARATESDAGNPIGLLETVTPGTAGETGTARAMTFAKSTTLGRATETAAALVTGAAKTLTYGRALGAGTASPLAFAKATVFGAVQETSTAWPVELGVPGVEYTAPQDWLVSTPPQPAAAGRVASSTAVTRTPSTARARSTSYTVTTRE